ncbi:MarR family transcriptional regulator [Paenibacillus ihbetae]|uniref:MarR family transcriptional regulator n=1 Tax=Paenibacillus ihbetae TaxID=1870820 RepID=A0A1B2EA82_9BACL|nr:MarR family transcriptional regulator [Paenibacillus ihbetae]
MTSQLLQGCLYFTTNQVTRTMTKMADEAFFPSGLPPAYAFVMIAINDHQGISQKELGEVLHIAPSTITLEKLQTKGLLYTEQQGKQSLIHSTDKGNALQADLEAAWINLYRRYSDLISVFGKQLTKQLHQVSLKLEK